MKPILHAQLVNSPFGDPCVYIDFLFERRALLLDIGDISRLPARKILRISHIFVSHTHMDHFIGFDTIVRVCLGREQTIALYGPPGFIAQVRHKLAAYTWNLVHNYETDFTLTAHELHPGGEIQAARFRCQTGFAAEELDSQQIDDGIILDEQTFIVRTATLDHGTPCLAYAVEEKQHINVWKNRLDEMGLPTGPWLHNLKAAILRGAPAETPISIHWRNSAGTHDREFTLGALMDSILRIVPGQKIAYVTDAIFSAHNAERIVALVNGAEHLFIETVFLQENALRAARTFHLTAHQAGTLAKRAKVKRVTPMHFSARYTDHAPALYQEIAAAFGGEVIA